MSLDQVLQGSQFCASFPWDSLWHRHLDIHTRGCAFAVRRHSPPARDKRRVSPTALASLFRVEGPPPGQMSLEAATGGRSSVSRPGPAALYPCFHWRGGGGGRWRCGAALRPAPLRSAPFWGEVTAQDFSVGTEQKRKHAPAVEVGCAWSSKPAGGIWCQGVWRLVWRSGHRVFLSAFVPSILAAAPSHVFNLMHFSHACGW